MPQTGGVFVDEATAASDRPAISSSLRRRLGAENITAVTAGTGTVYVGTHSILITIIAALAAFTLAVLAIATRR